MVDALTMCLKLSALLAISLAYREYRDEIPNGRDIPHPCKVNYRWPGVGHENPNGGGVRNVFGMAFAAAGRQWTKELCQADSDGDGMTNGQELGDPGCTWKRNTTASRVVNITHPGICDPFGSDGCKNKTTFVSCELDKFQACEGLNNSNVKAINLTFPESRVPASQTNYMCFSFDLPDDQDYHVIANEPIITNHQVVHHILLYGCKDGESQRPYNAPKETVPVACKMGTTTNCSSIIGLWTVGQTGNCYGDHVGFRIGKSGFRRVRMEIHYNNKDLVQNYTDASGLRLYYQPVQAGDQDLAMWMIGQFLLELPPGQSRVEREGVCSSSCTEMLIAKPAKITAVYNHMHYLGTSMSVSVYRNGTKLQDLSSDPAYSYDSPVSHVQKPEFELLPGDELRTTCVYNTLSSRSYVYYGEGTSDEMCFGFITFYPSDALKNKECLSFGNFSTCDMISGVPMDGCNWVEFMNFSSPASAKIVYDVTENCNLNGCCRPGCRVVQDGLKDHPCLKSMAKKWITAILSNTQEGVNFLDRLRSCPMSEPCTDQCQNCDPDDGGNTADRMMVNSAILLLITALLMFA